VNIHSGVRPEPGPVVMRYRGGTAVTQQGDGGVSYVVADQTSFALRVTSSAFRGFKRDRWFFTKANFAEDSDQGARCLAAYSY
jgi:hypothetical protein